MVGERAEWDSDGDLWALGIMGERELLADPDEGQENGEALLGCPWGYGSDGRDGVYDADGTESVGGTACGEEVGIAWVHGEADGLEGGAKVFDYCADVGPGLEAVVLMWLRPVAGDAVVGVAQLIIDEVLKPASAWVGVWRNSELYGFKVVQHGAERSRVSVAPLSKEWDIILKIKWKCGSVRGERQGGGGLDVELQFVFLETQTVVVCGGMWVEKGGLALLKDVCARTEYFCEHQLDGLAEFDVGGSSVVPQGEVGIV